MNKVFLLLACMMLLITGCTPKVARRPLTEREQQWQEFVKYYYPAWKPELTVAPAVQPDLVSTPAPQTFTTVEEPLPEMPPTEESELIFGEDSASLDSAVMPENSDVVKYESITAEVTEPVVAEETTTVEAAPAEAKDDKNNTATEENATTVKEEATPAENTAPAAKEDPAAAKEAAPEAKSSEPAAEEKDGKTEAKAPVIHVVEKGEMLGGIAQKYYGRASLWTVIQKANEETLKGSTNLRPGMKLVIPEI